MSDTQEQFCRDQIARIEADYRKAIEPWVKRLNEIYAMQPMPMCVMNFNQMDSEIVKQIVLEQLGMKP